jgi:hypothetical protein
MQLSIKILGILFLGISLLQASCWDTPPPEDSRSSSEQGLSTHGPWKKDVRDNGFASPPCSGPSTDDEELPPPFSLPPTLQHPRHYTGLETQIEALRVRDPQVGFFDAFMSTVAEREGPLSPCTAADQLRRLNDEDLHRWDLAARMAPSVIVERLSSDLGAITQSIENICRDFLQATSYSFLPRPADHRGRTWLWTTMHLLDVNLQDGQGKERNLVQFLTEVYGKNIATRPYYDAQSLLTPHGDNKIYHLQRILASWGSSLDISGATPQEHQAVLELLVGNTDTKAEGLLRLGHTAWRYTQRLNGLSPRLAPQTPPPVQRQFDATDTMQECA